MNNIFCTQYIKKGITILSTHNEQQVFRLILFFFEYILTYMAWLSEKLLLTDIWFTNFEIISTFMIGLASVINKVFLPGQKSIY